MSNEEIEHPDGVNADPDAGPLAHSPTFTIDEEPEDGDDEWEITGRQFSPSVEIRVKSEDVTEYAVFDGGQRITRAVGPMELEDLIHWAEGYDQSKDEYHIGDGLDGETEIHESNEEKTVGLVGYDGSFDQFIDLTVKTDFLLEFAAKCESLGWEEVVLHLQHDMLIFANEPGEDFGIYATLAPYVPEAKREDDTDGGEVDDGS